MAESRQTRSTLKDFLAALGSSANMVDLSPAPDSETPTDAINEGDDLGIDPNSGLPMIGVNGVAAAYVAYLTQQNANFYEIAPQGEEAAPSNRGNELTPPDRQGAVTVFARPGTTLGEAMNLSNSGRLDATDYPVASYLDKTAGDDTRSGNTMLSNVIGRPNNTTGNPEIETNINVETQSGKMQQSVIESIVDANRFNSQRGGVAVPNQLDSIDTQKLQSAQRDFSVYQKDDSSASQAYDYERLKDVGNWLLASAAGYVIPGNENENQTVDQFFAQVKNNSSKSEVAVSAELSTNLGADNALSFSDVQASNARGYPKQPDGRSMRSERGSAVQPVDDDAVYTKPSPITYTSSTPFLDPTNAGSVKVAKARALIAINRLASLYNSNIVKEVEDDNNTLKSLGPYYMGGSVYSRVNALNRMMMNVCYVPTRNPYNEAVTAGIGLMLGKKGIGTTSQISGYFGALDLAPGFWEAVAASAFDIIKKQSSLAQTITSGDYPLYYVDLGRSKAVQVMNVFATIGDIYLQVSGKKFNADTFKQDISAASGVENVDNLPVTAGTRISKSREGSGRSPLALSWRNNSVPGLYLLSDDVVRASIQTGNLSTGENPARGMLASSLVEKTYTDPTMRGSKARIPADIVKVVEDKLDAEYVPFYFHDLRTNEIISFHAFLDSLQESFSAKFSSFKSYGRSDSAKMYTGTDRTVSLSFSVVATSRDDFDEMWYKLNRLIACVYPKYTPGTLVENGNITFEQPFSQVIGATPLMRLRVGDVVKSNYSRFNLSRFFGIGSDGVDVSKYEAKKSEKNGLLDTIANAASAVSNFSNFASTQIIPEKYSMTAFYALFGSPLKSIAGIKNLNGTASSVLSSPAVTGLASNFLVNGFVNPLGYGLMTSFTQNPDNLFGTTLENLTGLSQIPGIQNAGGQSALSVLPGFSFAYLKPRERPYDITDAAGNIIGKGTVRRAIRVRVTKKIVNSNVPRDNQSYQTLNPISDLDAPTGETRYLASVFDASQFAPRLRDGQSDFDAGDLLLVTHDDLQPDLSVVFAPAALAINPLAFGTELIQSAVDSAVNAVNLDVSSILDDAASSGLAGFMSPQNNAVVRAFENNKGRGLAGVITQLSFNWLDFNWETDWGARAPMGTKVTISFECMHDLPPGLDASGYMRAPTHNVGSVMNTIAGDPHTDGGVISRTNFSRDGASTVVKR